jgi:hypothetical protein
LAIVHGRGIVAAGAADCSVRVRVDGMSAWAKVGVKCVCIDFTPVFICARPHPADPVAGGVYTVTGIWHDEDGTFLQLAECDGDSGYEVSDFRPLVTRTQEDDVALFRDLLVSNEVDA